MMAPAPKRDPNSPWYVQVINAVADVVMRILSLKGGMAALIIVWILVIISWATFQFGRPITDSIVAKLSAESSAATAVGNAVTRLTSIAEEQQRRTDALESQVEANGQAIKQMLAEGSMPAREIKAMMEQAVKIMEPVPALRERDARATEELLGIQKQVLETLKAQSKNALEPTTTQPSGA